MLKKDIDSKSKCIDEYITHANKGKLFGTPHKLESNYAKFPTAVSKVLDLFWSTCSNAHVPNNEYMAWVVKGFIAKKKGIWLSGLQLKGENNEYLIRVHL